MERIIPISHYKFWPGDCTWIRLEIPNENRDPSSTGEYCDRENRTRKCHASVLNLGHLGGGGLKAKLP